MTLLEAAKQALDTLEGWSNYGEWVWHESALQQSKRNTKESIEALRQAIEQADIEKADALPPTADAIYWMEMVVSNLVRNGVNKHRAKELAHHFYTYTTPREKMKIDNSTGKNKEFYELGKKMFDRLQPIAPKPSKIEINLNADIELLRQVNSADIEALENAKETLQIIKEVSSVWIENMIDESLALINKALGMSHGEAFDRLISKAKEST